MKTTITATIFALLASTAVAGPNNYIYTDNDGVVYELENGGATYVPKGEVTSRDMATQAELDALADDIDNAQGMSMIAALGSFTGNGVGVGLSGDFDDYTELSVGVGAVVTGNIRAVGGLTIDDSENLTGSVGIGISF